jgi:hypothetical protein
VSYGTWLLWTVAIHPPVDGPIGLSRGASLARETRNNALPMKLRQASPPSPQFVPTLLSILLTILVLGIVWHIIYDQIIGTMSRRSGTAR